MGHCLLDIQYYNQQYQLNSENFTRVSFCVKLVFVPVQTLLVKFDHNLWDSDVGLFSWNQVRLLVSHPLNKEVELPRVVGGTNDLLSGQISSKSFGLLLLGLL